jgi:SAM-dependent methyltransferase
MILPDRLHCPDCKGRLAAVSDVALRCTGCERIIRTVGDIADFVGDPLSLGAGADRDRGDPHRQDTGAADLFPRIKAVAGDRWPPSLGDIVEFGCGRGDTTQAVVADQAFRGLLVIDTQAEMLQACRARIIPRSTGADRLIAYATLSGALDAVRDAVADTVIGSALLSGINDTRTFLAMVHRILRPGGRAMFVVPNRRYHQAMCLAMAEALVQRHARDGAWPEGQQVALEFLAQTRRLLVHRGDPNLLSDQPVKHLFDSEALEDLGNEAGFATTEMIPLDPDPAGADTTGRICREAGAPADFYEMFGPLAASVGQPFFDLLGRRDCSASMLLWLTKARGPAVRIFPHQPAHQRPAQIGADVALGGASPHWSIELLARDTPGGILVSVGGWCLCNTDVQWVRLTLGDVARHAPVWRPRPDVHEVLNRSRVYHPLNTLCSGLASELMFEGVHTTGEAQPFRLDIVLTNGATLSGPAPGALVMRERMVIAH